MPTSIKIENLSKQYRLGVIGTGTLSHDLKRWWTTSIRGKEDPYLKIGETNVIATRNSKPETRNSKLETRNPQPETRNSQPETRNSKLETRNSKLESQYVWALRDINLEIEQGDVVGIIGKNGAGKSTLLKILSRVTKPTTGSIKYNGRIASLLEVGTGFHQEMTGRENIYMNGAIMGMTRHEITSKLDEIIAFAGVERYIDTPVKRYSSGMTVRLGFSIAAHLEPDILVVDEVLAVGDAEFQKKAIGKMQDVSKGGGRTVLFVSHNMAAVKSLCGKGIILEKGIIKEIGTADHCVGKYLKGDANINNYRKWQIPEIKNQDFELLEIGIKKRNADFIDQMRIDDELEFCATFKQKNPEIIIDTTLHIKDEEGNKLFSTSSAAAFDDNHKKNGLFTVKSFFPANFFNWGNFHIDLFVVEDRRKAIMIENDVISFTLLNKDIPLGVWMGREPGGIMPHLIWEKNYVSE